MFEESNISFNRDQQIIIIENAFEKNVNKKILDEMINNEKQFEPAKVGNNNELENNIRKNLVCYYDTVYSNKRDESVLLNTLNEAFGSAFLRQIITSSCIFPLTEFLFTNYHETQVSRYGGNSDKYEWHLDSLMSQKERMITMVYYAFNEPKKFTGGEICFSNSLTANQKIYGKNEELKIEPKNNMLVIFSSTKPHAVANTSSPEEFKDGRFSVNCWIGIR